MSTKHLTAPIARAFVIAHLGLQGLSAEAGSGRKSVVHVARNGAAPVTLRVHGASGDHGWPLTATEYLDVKVKSRTQHFSRKKLVNPHALHVFVRIAPVPVFYVLTEREVQTLVFQSYTREGNKRGDKPGQFTRIRKDSVHDMTFDRYLAPFKVAGPWGKVRAALGITRRKAGV